MDTIGYQSAAHAPRRVDSNLIMALLVLATFLTFARSLGNGFINFDDPGYVTEARMVQRGITAEGVKWAFTTGTLSNWHPLTWLSHMLDVQLFGLSPGGHHLTSVLFHSANVALLFLLLKRTTGCTLRSAFAAALFGLHPLRVESVAWVSERKDVLSTFFGLLALLSYANYAAARSARAYVMTLVWFALGLMAKPMLVTLPCVMLLMDYWPLRRLRGWRDVPGLVREKAPLVALAVAASVVTFIAQRVGGSMGALEKYPVERRVVNAVVAYARYLGKSFWPTDLSIFYPYPADFPVLQVAAALLLLVAVTVSVIVLARQLPYLFVGWFWFVGTLVPVIGLVQVGRQAMADRYTYLPHIGLFIAVTWALGDLAARWRVPGRALRVCAAIVLVALAAATVTYIGHWRDASSLFGYVLQTDPTNPLARHQLANELARRDDLDGAEAQYRAVLKSHPDDALALLNLGNIEARRKRLDLAEPFYREALRLKPSLTRAHLSLGLVLARQRRFAEAEQSFAEALEQDPESALAHYQMGAALREQGRSIEAAAHFQSALRLDPKLADAARALAELRAAAATRPATAPSL
ncbi:MAG: tetratricopeptide repeat protein [Tepidisphaeraceae bacterium]